MPQMIEHLVTKTALKGRGWTDKLIRDFLPAPDHSKPNPYYRSGPPMLLYAADRVKAIEASAEFVEAMEKANRRRASGEKAVETKRAEVLAYVDRIKVVVPQLDRDKLIQRACWHYNDMQDMRRAEGMRASGLAATPESGGEFLGRIAVNYLRHQLTSYERNLERVAGKVGVREAVMEIRQKVFAAIGQAYPWLADECQRQLKWKEEADLWSC